MPITIKRDLVYSLLKKISEAGQGKQKVDFSGIQSGNQKLTEADLLGHLDYLNQNHYINADFTDDSHVNQVELTDLGRQTLQKFETKTPKTSEGGSSVAIAPKDLPFLEKVLAKGDLEDVFDARDITEVVFRTMRDVMTTEASDRVAQELHAPAETTDDKALQNEVADLWKDTNPIVAFLSRIRPPLNIKSDTFLFRIQQESALQRDTDVEKVVKAVFSATKEELSQERIQEVSQFLPDTIRQLWDEA